MLVIFKLLKKAVARVRRALARVVTSCFRAVCLLYRVPMTREDGYEAVSEQLMLRRIDKSDKRIQSLVYGMSDDMIIHQKGELPELVEKAPDGSMVPQRGSLMEVKYYYARLDCFIRDCIGNGEVERGTFLDVGATSDLFFRLLGKKGTGLNVSEGALEKMRTSGIAVINASADNIPCKDGSFDYVICFNTLGHLENPVLAMREMKRVCRKVLFVSMGDSDRFDFLDYTNDRLGIHRWHKFRWTREAFIRLTGFLDLRLIKESAMPSFGEPENFREGLFQGVWGAGRSYRAYALAVGRE